MRSAKAFSPGAISSFFEIRDMQNGTRILDLDRVGAIGGGFGIDKGSYTKVTVQEAEKNQIDVSINKQVSQANTTRYVAETILKKTDKKYKVCVEHQVELPIGMGFGTSAGGALTTGIALCKAIDLALTYNEIGRIAHISEIHCITGLGTVSSLTSGGGLILVTEAGAPGTCKIDRIPLSPDYVIVAGFYKKHIPKKSILSSPEKREEINRFGKRALEKILSNPSLENFLNSCWDFAQNSGLATENICKLVDIANKSGAIGAAQNMIGEAVHAVVHKGNANSVIEAFKRVLPQEQVIVSKIDFLGPRLIK